MNLLRGWGCEGMSYPEASNTTTATRFSYAPLDTPYMPYRTIIDSEDALRCVTCSRRFTCTAGIPFIGYARGTVVQGRSALACLLSLIFSSPSRTQ